MALDSVGKIREYLENGFRMGHAAQIRKYSVRAAQPDCDLSRKEEDTPLSDILVVMSYE